MNTPHILVILGSIREGRAGERVASWFMEATKQVASAQLELVDLRDFPLPFFADAQTPSGRTGPHANPQVQKWLDKVASADGYIFITAEYNHSVPAVLKNALDYPYKEWNNKAVGFVSYGGAAGGSRAVEHLRQIASELRMHDVRDQVMIPFIWNAFDAQGNLEHGEAHAKGAILVAESVAKLALQLKG